MDVVSTPEEMGKATHKDQSEHKNTYPGLLGLDGAYEELEKAKAQSEEEAIKELNMNAFLAVSQASVNKPRLIVMKYHNNPSSKEILGLVGKGLTYDSGGLSIKPTDSMLTMKSDMAGAAAVLSTMCCISSQDLKINVTAVIAACENSISGNAYRPGDILTTMAGKTVEIMNTDAEGRLTLADAVTYAIKNEKVTSV